MDTIAHASEYNSKPLWLQWPLIIFAIVIPMALLLMVQIEHWAGMALAYLNCLIIGRAMVYFVRKNSMPAILPVFFMLLLVMPWPIASLVMAMTNADFGYTTLHGTTSFLSGSAQLQFVLLVFVICYLATVIPFVRRREGPRPIVPVDAAGRLAILGTVVGFVGLGINVLSKLVELPSAVTYVADGAFLYLNGLFLIVGVLFKSLSSRLRLFTICGMVLFGGFYTLGNARGMAMLPFLMFLFGLLFMSAVKARTKLTMVIVMAIVAPFVIVVGNTTRTVTNSIGFGDLESRIQAMGRWQEVLDAGPVLGRSFGRVFMTGGHTIITQVPDSYSYMPFDPQTYFTEMFSILLPGALYYQPHYSHVGVLIQYGFYITEQTSVEVSMVGGQWMLGGYIPVILGAIFVGCLHGLLIRIVRNAEARSPTRALFYMAMMAPVVMWGPNLTVLAHFRVLVWHMIVAWVLYYLVVRPITGEQVFFAEEPHELAVEGACES